MDLTKCLRADYDIVDDAKKNYNVDLNDATDAKRFLHYLTVSVSYYKFNELNNIIYSSKLDTMQRFMNKNYPENDNKESRVGEVNNDIVVKTKDVFDIDISDERNCIIFTDYLSIEMQFWKDKSQGKYIFVKKTSIEVNQYKNTYFPSV
jgi:hypothetical protein